MKKLFIILATMMVFPMVCNAQLDVVSEVKEADSLASSRMGAVQLKLDKNTYYLRMKTTNQFDKAMLFYLGTTPESAVKTLQDLSVVASTLKKKTHLEVNGGQDIYNISREAMNTLWFTARGYAGIGSVTKAELERFIDTICEHQAN